MYDTHVLTHGVQVMVRHDQLSLLGKVRKSQHHITSALSSVFKQQ